MNKRVVLIGFIILFSFLKKDFVLADDSGLNYVSNSAVIQGFGMNSIPSGFGYRPFRHRPNLYRNGVLTGFSPPVHYNPQNYYYSNPVNNGLFARVRRVFNPNYNSYVNYGGFDPYINNNLNNNHFIPFFGNNSNGINSGNSYNGIIQDGFGTVNSGATVTIID